MNVDTTSEIAAGGFDMTPIPYNQLSDWAKSEYDTIKKNCHDPNVPLPPGMYLYLYHGRPDPHQDMDDWGKEGPAIGPLNWGRVTYCSSIFLGFVDGKQIEGPIQQHVMCLHQDLLYWDGMFYGDWEFQLRGANK